MEGQQQARHTPEIYDRAASFYEEYPTGQYDDEAAHALRCHFALVAAMKDALEAGNDGDWQSARQILSSALRAAGVQA